MSLFEFIDKELWIRCEQNPILFLERISLPRFQELEQDTVFVENSTFNLPKVHIIYDAEVPAQMTKDCVLQHGVWAS